MTTAKKEAFDIPVNEAAEFARALSHPARIQILQVLANRKSCVCGDVVDELPLAQSTVSQHLKQLKEAGLIDGNVDGPSVCYCINTKEFARLMSRMTEILSAIDAENRCC